MANFNSQIINLAIFSPRWYDGLPSCVSEPVTLGEFGIVPPRKNVPVFCFLPHAGGSHLLHGPGSEYSWRAVET